MVMVIPQPDGESLKHCSRSRGCGATVKASRVCVWKCFPKNVAAWRICTADAMWFGSAAFEMAGVGAAISVERQ